MLDKLRVGEAEVGAVLSLLRGLEILGRKKERDEGPPGGAGARATSGFRSGRKEPAHLLPVQASGRISSLKVQISGRRPPGTDRHRADVRWRTRYS